MLLFSSRDHLTLPGLCLWVLITVVRIHCSYAFEILSHKSAAPSSSSPLSTSRYSPPPSPTVSPIPSNQSSFLSPSSQTLKFLLPNKLYLRYHLQHSKPLSSSQLLRTSIDAKPTHSSRIIKRAIPRLIPHPTSSTKSLISFTPDVRPLRNPKNPRGTKVPFLLPATTPKVVQPSDIASIKEKQKLRSYFDHVQKMKSLKSALRRRMKEKSILKSKLLETVNPRKNRLAKMAKVEAVALAKSPPKAQTLRSIKARRADYFVHRHSSHSGSRGSKNIDFPHGSIIEGFNGENGFVNPQNVPVFHDFAVGKGSAVIPDDKEGFIIDHLPKNTQVDFIVDGNGGFLSPQSSGNIPRPLSPQQPSSPLLSSSHSSLQNNFGQFPSKSDQDSFDGFLNVPQSEGWDVLPPIQQQPSQSDGFGFFDPSDVTNDMGSHEVGFHIEPSLGDAFVSDWGQGDSASSFTDNENGFVPGFGSFQQNDRDCETIGTKSCQSSRDCECNGFYTCMGSRCVLKGSSTGDDDEDSLGGFWHDDVGVGSIGPMVPMKGF